MIVAIEFPNPVGWTIDQVTGFVGGAATTGFELIVGGLTAWVVDATVWVVGGVFNFFLDSTDPNVQADWYITDTGPYATTASIGATLLLLFVLAGIVQGTLDGDAGGMLRRLALDLPVSVLGMVGLVTVTQAAISLTDALSMQFMDLFHDDISDFGAVVASLDRLNGGTSTAFVVFVLALVTVLAGLVLVAELVIRSALIYIVVAFAPLVFAARVWPATRGATRKLLELLCALILSKLVIAVALSVAAAAAVGTGSGGEVNALPEPEAFAEDPGGSVTQAVGILLTAAAAFGVAAFSPMLIARLLPMTEAAVVSQGVRGGPYRAGQQGLTTVNSMRMARGGHRLSQIAGGQEGGARGGSPGAAALGSGSGGGSAGAAGGASAGSAGGASAAGAGAAAAGPIAAVAAVGAAGAKAAKGAATKGAETGARIADEASSPPERPVTRRSGPTRPEPSPGTSTKGGTDGR